MLWCAGYQEISPMNNRDLPRTMQGGRCRLKALALLAISPLAGYTDCASAHGSVSDPVSRVYRIFQENPETPGSDVSAAAIATAGTQAFYDWHEVSRVVPEYDPGSLAPYQALIPDGQLAGAGREKYAGLNLVREDWPATPVNPGPYPVEFDAWVPHDPSYFRAYITRDGWSPDQPLRWEDLEPLAGADQAVRDENYYRFTVDFPQRSGHHVLYVIWQRIDPAGEVFFSASDIDFGDGTGNGNVGRDPDDRPVIPHDTRAKVDFSIQSDWESGFTAEAKISNIGNHPINSWELEFEIEQEISSFWNAELIRREGDRYTVRHDGWNQSIPAGGSVVFGFSATPGNLAVITPGDVTLNGVSLHNHVHEPHRHAVDLAISADLQPSGEGSRIHMSFPSMAGRTYAIEESADLFTWEVLESGIPGDGLVERHYPAEGRKARFFRVREEHH